MANDYIKTRITTMLKMVDICLKNKVVDESVHSALTKRIKSLNVISDENSKTFQDVLKVARDSREEMMTGKFGKYTNEFINHLAALEITEKIIGKGNDRAAIVDFAEKEQNKKAASLIKKARALPDKESLILKSGISGTDLQKAKDEERKPLTKKQIREWCLSKLSLEKYRFCIENNVSKETIEKWSVHPYMSYSELIKHLNDETMESISGNAIEEDL